MPNLDDEANRAIGSRMRVAATARSCRAIREAAEHASDVDEQADKAPAYGMDVRHRRSPAEHGSADVELIERNGAHALAFAARASRDRK